MDGCAHDGLGENVEQVSTHRQDALDAHGHERRGNDETAAGADTPGDETGGQAHCYGCQKDVCGVKGWRIGGFAAQHFVVLIGFCQATRKNGNCQRQQEKQFFAVFENGSGDFQVPFGVSP